MSPVDPRSEEFISGSAYWRSLRELAGEADLTGIAADEFPPDADQLETDGPTRRQFLQLLGASVGLAGATACSWPKEEILPYARRPRGQIPGTPLFFATSFELGGVAHGLLATSYDGRPIKIDGNPLHPDSVGGSSVWAQASVLDLYDPDRSRMPAQFGRQVVNRTWDEFTAFVQPHMAALRQRGGAGLYVLSEASASPSMAEMRRRFAAAFPQAQWLEYEPLSWDTARAGTALAYSRPYRVHLNLSHTQVLLTLDEDVFAVHPASVRWAHDFAARRNPDQEMIRLYAIESGFSLAGAMADHRVAVPASAVMDYGFALAVELLHQGLSLPGDLGAVVEEHGALARVDTAHAALLRALAADLLHQRGASAIVAGPRQPALLHALVAVLNEALGNVGPTITYTDDLDTGRPAHVEAIRTLVTAMQAGRVETLIILGGNPVFTAPADLDFAASLERVPTSVHLSLYRDETSQRCTWHLPRAHYLEAWGDGRAWDGTYCTAQPLIRPLYDGKSAIELLSLLIDPVARDGYTIVRETFAAQLGLPDTTSLVFDREWRLLLNDGVAPKLRFRSENPTLQVDTIRAALASVSLPGPAVSLNNLELVFGADSRIYDGRFANNGWLQEVPDFLTKVAWDNVAAIAPATAKALRLVDGDTVLLTREGRQLEIAVTVVPGLPPHSVHLTLGGGRSAAGRVGNGAGFDTYQLRTSGAMGYAVGLSLQPTGRRYPLAVTQDHHAIDTVGLRAREQRLGQLVREADLTHYRRHPDFAQHTVHHPPLVSLWKDVEYDGYRWGMAIDLNACIGCNACVIACQAENNIPIVGKKQVQRGREMHWLRIDRYFRGPEDAPQVVHQPVACHHCENAPCEQVCPVAATLHDHDGLNVMVYNRCVGTRYCSNNCPYKVRRFNFFNYQKRPFRKTEIEHMVNNPDVTIRARGVMEKCTYCVQRIARARIAAKNEGRQVQDGEVVPACAQACPTRAIVFGDLRDPASRVSTAQAHARAYAMLGELNVRPRTVYLARVRNPNPALAPSEGAHEHGSGHS